MGGFGFPPPLYQLIESTPDYTRRKQQEHFRRLEEDHRERVVRHERATRRWFTTGYFAFSLAILLAVWGIYEVLC